MTLEHTRDNKTRAAEILGISLKTLHNKLNRLKLRKSMTSQLRPGLRLRSVGRLAACRRACMPVAAPVR